jgi:hypothetical protein
MKLKKYVLAYVHQYFNISGEEASFNYHEE